MIEYSETFTASAYVASFLAVFIKDQQGFQNVDLAKPSGLRNLQEQLRAGAWALGRPEVGPKLLGEC